MVNPPDTAVLGIDPGLTAIGLAAGTGYADLRTIKTAPLRGAERLSFISDVFEDYLDQGPEFVLAVIEGYSRGSLQGREEQGEAGGIIRRALWRAGVPYVEVAPKSLKLWLTGSGGASKARMMSTVQLHMVDAVDEHQADATALRWIGMEAMGFETPLAGLRLPQVETVRQKLPKDIRPLTDDALADR